MILRSQALLSWGQCRESSLQILVISTAVAWLLPVMPWACAAAAWKSEQWLMTKSMHCWSAS